MTTTPVSHPAWCDYRDNDEVCDGHHWHHVMPEDYVPADRSRSLSAGRDACPSLPLFAAHLRWLQSDGHGVEIVLHEREDDEEWIFSLGVAFELVTHILESYVTAMDELPVVPMPLPRTWDAFRAAADRIALRRTDDRTAAVRKIAPAS